MSGKYQRLFSLEKNLYKEGAPVIVLAGAILKDTVNSKILAQIKFKNIGFKPIKALKVRLSLFDTAGHDLESFIDFQYLDLNLNRNGEYGEQVPIIISNSYARSMSVFVTEVVYCDGEVWEEKGTWMSLGELDSNATIVNDFGVVFGEKAKYVPTAKQDLWFCTCGAINRREEVKCCECGICKDNLFACLQEEFRKKEVIYTRACCGMRQNNIVELEKALVLFEGLNGWKDSKEKADKCRGNIIRISKEIAQKEQEDKLEKIRLEKEKENSKRRKKKYIIACGLVGILTVGACLFEYEIYPGLQFYKAEQLLAQGKYSQAEEVFSSIRHVNCSEKLQECEYEKIYQEASALYERGQYEEAKVVFGKVTSYKNSNEQIEKCKESILLGKYEVAKELYAKGDYTQALSSFEEIKEYNDSEEWISKCDNAIKLDKYEVAKELYAKGDYTQALSSFEEIKEYNDSEDWIIKCDNAIKQGKYKVAMELYNEKKYEEALEVFAQIIDYEDSKAMLEACEEIICAEKYSKALQYAENNKYGDAYALLMTIPEYKDSQQKAEKFLIINRCKKASVGSEIRFGSYYYNRANTKDSITWIVLEKDEDELLLISKNIIETGFYNLDRDNKITWEQSDIREWLNGRFYDIAFTETEKTCILTTYIRNNDYVSPNKKYQNDCGNDTYDKVFLLSYDEVDRYFPDRERSKAYPTEYTKGKIINGIYDDELSGCWMLRTVSDSSVNSEIRYVCVIEPLGGKGYQDSDDSDKHWRDSNDYGNRGYGIRPVIKIKYN